MEKLKVYSFGKTKLGKSLKKPHEIASSLMKKVKGINECYVLTGDWDILIEFEAKDMDDYYNKTWEYGKFLEEGFGAIVAKEYSNQSRKSGDITIFVLGRLELGKDLKNPDEIVKNWFEEFDQIENVCIMTGRWDVMIKLKAKDMKEYFHTIWSIGKYLQEGSGYVVSKTIKS